MLLYLHALLTVQALWQISMIFQKESGCMVWSQYGITSPFQPCLQPFYVTSNWQQSLPTFLNILHTSTNSSIVTPQNSQIKLEADSLVTSFDLMQLQQQWKSTPAALETSMANMQTQAVSGIIEPSHGLDILTRSFGINRHECARWMIPCVLVYNHKFVCGTWYIKHDQTFVSLPNTEEYGTMSAVANYPASSIG